jgi:hypothetical protein
MVTEAGMALGLAATVGVRVATVTTAAMREWATVRVTVAVGTATVAVTEWVTVTVSR